MAACVTFLRRVLPRARHLHVLLAHSSLTKKYASKVWRLSPSLKGMFYLCLRAFLWKSLFQQMKLCAFETVDITKVLIILYVHTHKTNLHSPTYHIRITPPSIWL